MELLCGVNQLSKLLRSCRSTRPGLRRPICAASTGSARRAFTIGRPSTPEGAGERERQVEEAFGGRHARQCGAEGPAGKKMVTPDAKRKAVAHLRFAFGMSERRACRTIGCVRMTVRYRCRRPDDAALRQRLRALADERRRFGYRRLHVREGFTVNHRTVRQASVLSPPVLLVASSTFWPPMTTRSETGVALRSTARAPLCRR